MKKNEKGYILATPEMVDQMIEEFYSAGFQRMDFLLNSIAVLKKPGADIERIVSDAFTNRKKLIEKVSAYEDELAKMQNLATVLLDQYNLKNGNNSSFDGYINYLLEKNMTVIPDIIEIIQILKNK